VSQAKCGPAPDASERWQFATYNLPPAAGVAPGQSGLPSWDFNIVEKSLISGLSDSASGSANQNEAERLRDLALALGEQPPIMDRALFEAVRQKALGQWAAFSRIFTVPENIELRKAHAITKGYPNVMDIIPVSTEVGSTNTDDDSAEAYKQSMEMAEKQHRLSPTLTIAQLFARVFEQNPVLAARAHQRPSASTPNYE
jgi:hypothetical protein